MAIVMVANEGVMDLLLNFLCSAEEIHLDLKSVVVFVGDQKYVELVEGMGANAMYSPSLGSMPAHAAETYLDDTFSRFGFEDLPQDRSGVHSSPLFSQDDVVQSHLRLSGSPLWLQRALPRRRFGTVR